jgi:hypothetical protein
MMLLGSANKKMKKKKSVFKLSSGFMIPLNPPSDALRIGDS